MALKSRQFATITEKSSKKANRANVSLSDLVIPIFSLFILILIIVFVFIPMTQEALEMRKDIDEVKGKQQFLTEYLNSLSNLSSQPIQQDLSNSKRVVPSQLEVSDFAYYVDSLAKSKGLVFREISAGDIEIQKLDAENLSVSNVSGVSGPLSYTGSYDAISEFLDELKDYSPYIVRTENIELIRLNQNMNVTASENQDSTADSQNENQTSQENTEDTESTTIIGDDEWSVELVVVGYYLPEASEIQELDIYLPLDIYIQYSQIVEIFRTKATQLNK